MEQSPSPYFMEAEGSLLCLQVPAICPYLSQINRVHASPPSS